MKRLTMIICALALMPLAAHAQEDNGFFDWGSENETEQQQQQEESDWQVIDQQTEGATGQEQLGETEQRQAQEEIDVVKTQELTRQTIEQQSIPTVQVCEEYADVNKMEAKHFEALGFSAQESQTIVQQREQRGGFQSVDELAQIQGVNPNTFASIRDSLSTSRRQAQEDPKPESGSDSGAGL